MTYYVQKGYKMGVHRSKTTTIRSLKSLKANKIF